MLLRRILKINNRKNAFFWTIKNVKRIHTIRVMSSYFNQNKNRGPHKKRCIE